jgi:hypothetical protein
MSKSAIQILSIQEQTIEDPVSGTMVKFIFVSGSESPSRILFKKASDTVWREYSFDANGEFAGAATRAVTSTSPQPALRLVK